MTSQLLSCWHLKSYRERLGMNGMIFVYLSLREDSITNEHWYFGMVNIIRGWIHVRNDRFSKFRNRKNLQSLESFGKWRHKMTSFRARATCTAKMSLIPSALPNVLVVMACRWIVGIVKIWTKWCYGTWGNNQYRNLQAEVYFEAPHFFLRWFYPILILEMFIHIFMTIW